MKQRISTKQVLGLSDRAKEKLIGILGITGNSGIDCPEKMIEALRLNIGQMIEFLQEHKALEFYVEQGENEKREVVDMAYLNWIYPTTMHKTDAGVYTNKLELCDALWEAVKQILES